MKITRTLEGEEETNQNTPIDSLLIDYTNAIDTGLQKEKEETNNKNKEKTVENTISEQDRTNSGR